MSSSTPTEAQAQSSTPSDPTFRNYAPSQARQYAQNRRSYPPQLISTIIDMHKSTSPSPSNTLDIVVDVGCGPGTATRSLAPHFDVAIGLDPGEAMIETAHSLGGTTKSGKDIKYAVSGAEIIDTILQSLGVWDGKKPCVDLITAATSAHWFDLPLFYAAAAKVLKPGGSIILWTHGSIYIDRRKYSEQVGSKVQEILDRFEIEVLRPYELEGNRLVRGLYKDLIMPWGVSHRKAGKLGLEVFEKAEGVSRTWNEDGKIEEGLEGGWMRGEKMHWKQIGMALGTSSPVTRFREVNREKLERGEMEDCVEVVMREVREASGGMEEFEGGLSTGVVVVKKRLEEMSAE